MTRMLRGLHGEQDYADYADYEDARVGQIRQRWAEDEVPLPTFHAMARADLLIRPVVEQSVMSSALVYPAGSEFQQPA